MSTTTTKPTETLRRLHAALVAPFEWDASTPELVAEILAEAGYRMPPAPLVDTTVEDGEEFAEELEWVAVDDPRLDAFRPAGAGLVELAREAIAQWDAACEALVGEYDAGDRLAEVLGLILDAEEVEA